MADRTTDETDRTPTDDDSPDTELGLDISLEDIADALPHRDHPDQEPPGAADAPVPG